MRFVYVKEIEAGVRGHQTRGPERQQIGHFQRERNLLDVIFAAGVGEIIVSIAQVHGDRVAFFGAECTLIAGKEIDLGVVHKIVVVRPGSPHTCVEAQEVQPDTRLETSVMGALGELKATVGRLTEQDNTPERREGVKFCVIEGGRGGGLKHP